jgi:ATP-dependent DNA helicase RecG
VAAATGRRADYTRNKGLAKDKLKAFVLQHLREFGPTPRIHLDELLFSALPQGLTDEQKKHKVKNLLTEMRAKDGSIRTNFQGKASVWAMAGAESFNEREH